MADNVAITAGTGTSIATDDIGGVQYQRVKLSLGADGSATDIGIGQAAMAASIPVALASDQTAIPVTDNGGSLTVDGTVELGATSLAALESVTVVDGGGSLTVDGTVELGATSLAALESITVTGPLTDAQLRASAVPVSEYDGELAISGGLTSYRERPIAQRYTVLSDSIADGLATFWTSTTASGGTNTVATGEGVIATSANAAGSAQLSSTAPSYLPGQSAWLLAAARFGDTGSAGNIRRLGAFTVSSTTPQDGYYFELSGTTLNAVSVKGGVASAVASTSWTKFSTAPFTLDANYHLWEIRWTANRADFYIDNVLRHSVSGTTSALTNTLNFPMTMHSINTSGATDRVLYVRNIGLGRFGAPDATTSDLLLTSYSVAGVIAINTVLMTVDCAKARALSIHCTSLGTTGVVSPEWSNDNTTWVAATIVPQAGTAGFTSFNNSTAIFTTPVLARYFRLRMSTATTAGTTTIHVYASQQVIGPMPLQQVGGTVTANLGTGGTGATSLGKARDSAIGATDTGVAILGVRRDTPTAETPVAGDYVVPQISQQGAQYVHPTFSGAAGATVYSVISAATTNAANVKASAGVLTSITAVNTNAAWRYLKFHNTAGTPTAGAAVVATYGIPPGGGLTLSFPSGVAFATGIGVSIVTGIATTDATAVGANDVAVTLTYH